MNFCWFLFRCCCFFHLEKKVSERPYGVLLQHNTYASSIPAHQVSQQWKCKPDPGVLFQRVQYCTVPLSGNKALSLIGEILMVQHTAKFWIVCLKFCVKSLGKTPPHKAKCIKEWFSQYGWEKLDWSAQSHDLNPIKHHWDGIKCSLWVGLYHLPTSQMLL